MSLRWKLALGTALVAILSAGFHFLVGYLDFRQAIENEIQLELKRWSLAAAQSVRLEGGKPRLSGEDWPWIGSGYTLGFRVLKEGRIYLEAGTVPQGPDDDWARTQVAIGEGYVLELYLNVGEYRRALSRQLRSGLLTLPLAAALAALLGFFLAHRLLLPLDRLARGVEKLSRVEFPDPLPEPRGRDELATLTRSFNRMARTLKEAFERERAFTRYASHELRNPLATLQAQLDALDLGVVPKEEAIAEARKALGRMHTILEGLLHLARTPRAELEPLPLGPLVETSLRGVPEPERDRITIEFPKDGPWVMADPELFQRVLENLLLNALKHGAGRIRISATEEGEKVVVEVRDEGPGVPPELLPKLTQPFFRLGARSGLGLGLALSVQAIRAMGGELTLSNGNPGLVARFDLDRAEVSDG